MILCADVGGSFIDLALVEDAVVRNRRRVPTPAEDWTAFVAVFAGFVTACGDAAGRAPLSIALAGLTTGPEGAIISANIPCIRGRALARDLSDVLHRPVVLTNDADCFVLAEAAHGAAQGHRDVFGVVLGTGVGGGLMIGGHLLSRAGVGGEWGHGSVVTRGGQRGDATPLFLCGCGQWGCLDTVGGARGLERLHRYLHNGVAESRQITSDWQAGDHRAAATIALYLSLLAGPLAMLLNTVPVTAVPVGGGLSHCAPLIEALDEAVRAQMLASAPAPLLVPSILRGDAGLLGAALRAVPPSAA